MKVRFALIAEGGSEEPLVRTLAELCRRLGSEDVRGQFANDLLALYRVGKTLTSQVEAVAHHQPEVNLIFVHRDADSPDDAPVRQHIAACVTVLAAPHVVAIVPIQETEAWLLVNPDEIRRIAGNPNGRAPLGLPKLSQIEAQSSPKELLRQALIRAAKPGRQQRAIRENDKVFGQMRQELLERLDLDGPVTQLTAWQRLLTDIQAAFAQLLLSAPET